MKKNKNYVKYLYRVPQREQVNESGYKRYIKKVEEAPRRSIEERRAEMLRIGEKLKGVKLRKVKTGYKRGEPTRKATVQDSGVDLRKSGVKLREYKEHQLHIPKRIIFTASRPERLIHLLEIIKGKSISSPQDAVLEILERVAMQEIKLLNVWDLAVNQEVSARYEMMVGLDDITYKREKLSKAVEIGRSVRIKPRINYYYVGITGNNNVELRKYDGGTIYLPKEQFEHGFKRNRKEYLKKIGR